MCFIRTLVHFCSFSSAMRFDTQIIFSSSLEWWDLQIGRALPPLLAHFHRTGVEQFGFYWVSVIVFDVHLLQVLFCCYQVNNSRDITLIRGKLLVIECIMGEAWTMPCKTFWSKSCVWQSQGVCKLISFWMTQYFYEFSCLSLCSYMWKAWTEIYFGVCAFVFAFPLAQWDAVCSRVWGTCWAGVEICAKSWQGHRDICQLLVDRSKV